MRNLELQGHADRRGTRNTIKVFPSAALKLQNASLSDLAYRKQIFRPKRMGKKNMTPEQVKQLVEQHPNLSQEQKDKNPEELEGGDADAEPARGHYLEQYRATVVRQFPFNAEDALTLHSPGTKKKQ